MSEQRPAFRTINGEGLPGIRIRKPADAWDSVFTATFTDTSVVEASGSTVNISSSAAGGIINTATAHGASVGWRIRIAGHTGSTPDINGDWYVAQVLSGTQLRIDCNITVGGGASGTVKRIPDFSRVQAGMVVIGLVTRTPDLEVYGKVTAVDQANLTLEIGNGWVGGTPTTGRPYSINGWFIDLPRCQNLTEEFTPDILVHGLWRGRKDSTFYGYGYRAVLDYSQYLSADTLYLLKNLLHPTAGDAVVLIPRRDKPGYEYNVYVDEEALTLELFGRAGGHRGFKLVFLGRELVDFPLNASGYGFNYAIAYGTGL
jgi:hypothetical protein